jgi:hypothetical protein
VEDNAVSFFASPFALLLLIPLVLLVGRIAVDLRTVAIRLRPWPGVVRLAPSTGWRMTAAMLALIALACAVAGPRLEPPQPIESPKPRDLMLVVDLSRSMLAEQPSRIEKASRALRSLADTLEKSGEARVGMIVFASKAELAFPLTSDIGHLRHVAVRLADLPPPSVESDAKFESGTRIGAALKEAVAGLVGHVGGEIVLLSDGDDPIDDEEWQAGITAARTAGIPIHTVVVGEPDTSATIPLGGDVLRYDDRVVKTRIQPERLEEIARRTGGQSWSAAKGTLALGPLLHETWREHPIDLGTDSLTPPLRSPMRGPFLVAALMAWLASWVRLPLARPRRLGQASAAFAILLLIGAAPAVENWLRRGNEAFGRRDFEEAIRCYRQALVDADDPGQVAFDLAAAHFRKEDYAAAVTAYRQALEDGELPPERRRRAWFDLGNALLAEAGTTDRRLVEEAMAAYRQCLAADPEPELRADAEHNLALAGRRWVQTQPPPLPDHGNEPGNTPDSNRKPENGADDPKNPQSKDSNADPTSDPNATPGVGDPKNGDKKTPARGPITVLPDSTDRAPLTAEDAAFHLERAIGRIERDRPPARPQDVVLRGKDW